MKLEAHVNGKEYSLTREELAANRFRVHLVGEDPVEVDVRRVETDVWSLLINGQSFEATVQPLNDKLRVSLRGTSWEIAVFDPRRKRAETSDSGAAEGKQVISSPMPGRVVGIEVKAGDTVEAGQGVIIVEAMKMENELTAEVSGTVKEIKVNEGEAVEDGQTLVVIE